MMRCGRCESGDLSVTDASPPDGFRIVCFTCGWVMLKEELQ